MQSKHKEDDNVEEIVDDPLMNFFIRSKLKQKQTIYDALQAREIDYDELLCFDEKQFNDVFELNPSHGDPILQGSLIRHRLFNALKSNPASAIARVIDLTPPQSEEVPLSNAHKEKKRFDPIVERTYQAQYPTEKVNGHGQNYKMHLCQHHKRGYCTKGQKCTYAHGVKELQKYNPGAKTTICPSVKMNQSCPRIAKFGTCNWIHPEDQITVANNNDDPSDNAPIKSEEAQPIKRKIKWSKNRNARSKTSEKDPIESIVPQNTYQAMKGAQKSSYKKVLCQYYSTYNGCNKGQNCEWAHGMEELKKYNPFGAPFKVNASFKVMHELPQSPPTQNPGYKTELCSYYNTYNGCRNGQDCKWAHGVEELRQKKGSQSPEDNTLTQKWHQGKVCDHVAFRCNALRSRQCPLIHANVGSIQAGCKWEKKCGFCHNHNQCIFAIHTMDDKHAGSSPIKIDYISADNQSTSFVSKTTEQPQFDPWIAKTQSGTNDIELQKTMAAYEYYASLKHKKSPCIEYAAERNTKSLDTVASHVESEANTDRNMDDEDEDEDEDIDGYSPIKIGYVSADNQSAPSVSQTTALLFPNTEHPQSDQPLNRTSKAKAPHSTNDSESKSHQTMHEQHMTEEDEHSDVNLNQKYDDATHPAMYTPALTFSEPYHMHVVSVDNGNSPSELDNITEDELSNIVGSVEMDVLVERLMQYMEHFHSQVNGMIQCSNRTDDEYNAAFVCNHGGTNAPHSDRGRHNKDNQDRDDDNKQNHDRDDQKYDPDEPQHPSLHGCNHLKECAECAEIVTRQDEHNKLLAQILHTHQQKMEFFLNLLSKCKPNHSTTNKTKNKFKSMLITLRNSMAESKPKHDLYPSDRAKKNIKLSRKMTQTIVPNATKEPISNGYAFMEKSIGMQCNDGQIQNNTDAEYQILNCDLDDKYCIMKRLPASHPNYKYQIEDQLFTASQATQLCGGSLPCSSRIPLQRMSAQYDIKQFTFDSQFVRRIIKRCKWNTIHVFKRKENKKRLTLTMTQEQLNPMIKRSMLSIRNDKTPLIPILMFDNTSNTHWIEYILVVHIRHDIAIGISLRYDSKGVRITGIHLDKVMILEQHEVLLSHSQHDNGACHCLDGFTSIIHDMRVGNCEALLNEMKSYKQKYGVFKQLAHKFINGKATEKYEILQRDAETAVKRDNGSYSPPSANSIGYGLQSPDTSLSSNSKN
eukprot:837609_1